MFSSFLIQWRLQSDAHTRATSTPPTPLCPPTYAVSMIIWGFGWRKISLGRLRGIFRYIKDKTQYKINTENVPTENLYLPTLLYLSLKAWNLQINLVITYDSITESAWRALFEKAASVVNPPPPLSFPYAMLGNRSRMLNFLSSFQEALSLKEIKKKNNNE